MSACADTDKNHLCDVCCVALDECVDADKDGVCDICNEAAKEDKTALLIPLLILLILMVVFSTGVVYFLLIQSKNATKPVKSSAKKTKRDAVASKAEKDS